MHVARRDTGPCVCTFSDGLYVGLSSLAWQQHDVQELCRVMFDALEQKWKQTVQVRERSSRAALQCDVRTGVMGSLRRGL